MNRCKRPAARLLAAAALLALAWSSPARAGELTFRAAAGARLSLAEMVPRLRAARFLLIGEEHGNHRHHDVQIRIIGALRDAGVPLATGLEAFPITATPGLERWVAGRLDSAPFYQLFDAGWSLESWPAYRDLLFFLRDRRIPSVGINADDALIRRVARDGYVSLTPAELLSLPPGGCVTNERYRDVIRRVVGGQLHENLFRNFCEAQSLRDSILARELAGIATAHPGYTVAGLVGLYHAWRPAVPARLEELGAGSVVVILPEEAPARTAADLAPEADFLWRWRD